MQNKALQPASAIGALPLQHGQVVTVGEDGRLGVQIGNGALVWCREYLASAVGGNFAIGQRLLLAEVACVDGSDWIVLGRLAEVGRDEAPVHLTVRATDSLTLECGRAKLDMHADGQVLLKGEDVTVRAKGTQRIRAGNVAIN